MNSVVWQTQIKMHLSAFHRLALSFPHVALGEVI